MRYSHTLVNPLINYQKQKQRAINYRYFSQSEFYKVEKDSELKIKNKIIRTIQKNLIS